MGISKIELSPASQLKSMKASVEQLVKIVKHGGEMKVFQISCTDPKSV